MVRCLRCTRRAATGVSVQILHFAAAELTGPPGVQEPAAPSRVNSPLWTRACTYTYRRNKKMLWTICIILLVLWALGMATSYTASGLIHILLVVALVVMVIRLIQGRRVV